MTPHFSPQPGLTGKRDQSTLLIVDDQPGAREVLRGLLAGQDYELVFATDGEEALDKAAALIPDLILLDVMMPGMDGFEVCRKVRADATLAEIPIIMITALDDTGSRLRGLELGADDFITKPFNGAELLARVRTITRLNRQRRLHMLDLQAERDRTRAILEALGEAVVVIDAEGTIQYANPAAAALTGFTLEEIQGKSWELWKSEETEEKLYDSILEAVYAGETWRGEMVNKRRDGTLYDTALTVAPFFATGDSSQPVGFVGVQRDITPLKKAEQAKDEFVSNVSHELRTPLSVLTLVSDNLDIFYDRLSDDKRRKLVQDMRKHIGILNDLISDILEISRIDSGRVSMGRETVNLTQLAQREIDELLPLAWQKSQTLTRKGLEQVEVWANPTQLQQVIRNLLTNAIKYTPDGGKIICECRILTGLRASNSPEMETMWPGSDSLPDNSWAALRVVDTGIGIDAEHLPYIFNRFYRAEVEQKIRGTGLGLAISRKLIELHDGHIAFVSAPDQGSTFAIYLPLSKQD